jgi:hypothetical protein
MLEVRDADAVAHVDRVMEAGALDHAQHAGGERAGRDPRPQRLGGVVERAPGGRVELGVPSIRRADRPAEARVAPLAGEPGDEVTDHRGAGREHAQARPAHHLGRSLDP